MAFRVETTTVTTTPTRVFLGVAGDLEVSVRTTSTVEVGGDSSLATSMTLGPASGANGQWFRFNVRPGDEVWAVSTSSAPVDVLVRSA